MTALLFLIAALAVYCVSYSIARLDGPFSVFAILRGHIDPHQKTWIGRGLNCVLCVSVWVALAVALLLQASVIEWLGLAGFTFVIDRLSLK